MMRVFVPQTRMRDQENVEKGEQKGRLEMLYSLVQDGLLVLADAARKAGMSEDVFEEIMNKMLAK